MTRRAVTGDERGAILLIAVFMAVFLVGLLYYAVAVGTTILEREGLQDAADATVLSAAIQHARGMNFVVLLNLVMAALLAVLVALKLVEGLAILGMAVAAGLAFLTAGASLVVVAPLKAVQQFAKSTYDSLKDPVFDGLEILHDTADAIRDLTPQAARLMVLSEVRAGGRSLTPVLTPLPAALPVEDDAFDRLCSEAGENVSTIATLPLSPLPGYRHVRGALGEAMGAMTGNLTEWFCGDSGGGPPTSRHTTLVVYPILDSARACRDEDPRAGDAMGAASSSRGSADASVGCEADADDEPPESEPATTNPICLLSEREIQEATPDCRTGECRTESDCTSTGPYERAVRLARQQCAPTTAPRPSRYDYQTRRGRVAYVWTRDGWVRKTPSFERPVRVHGAGRPPCGQPAATIGAGYRLQTHPDQDVTVILPVCTNESAPSQRPPRGTPYGTSTEVDFTEVSHILGCQKEETVTVTLDGEPIGGRSGEGKAPKAVARGLRLGDEAFQLRAVIAAANRHEGLAPALHVPLWGHDAPVLSTAERIARFGDLSFAQAEFYYDGNTDHDAWMWSMRWKARLRVFRDQGDAYHDELGRACSEVLPDGRCEDLLSLVDRVDRFAHH